MLKNNKLQSMSASAKTFFPNLDALRFFAFFAVFVNHAATSLGYKSKSIFVELFKYKYLSNGDLGVSFFFVLSGFLITYLLLHEKQDQGRIHIPGFYMRRVLRIWPLYFLVVLMCLLLVPMFQQYIHGAFPMKIGTERLSPVLYLTFLGNFDFVYHGISNTLIAPLWSVSVEEQFYLVWPLIIAFIPRKYLLPVFILLIAGSISYKLFLSGGRNVNLKFHTISSLSDLTCGAMLALLSFKESFLKKMRAMKRRWIILVYLLGITLFLQRFNIGMIKLDHLFIPAFLPFLFSLFFAFIIAEQNFAERSVFKLSRLKRISELGKYTYGMYCYHMLVFFFILLIAQVSGFPAIGMNKYQLILMTICGFIFTWIVSRLSYKYMEGPFLRLKEKFSE